MNAPVRPEGQLSGPIVGLTYAAPFLLILWGIIVGAAALGMALL